MGDKIQDTHEIADGFYIMNLGFVCIYLLRSGESYIAFDSGMKADGVRKGLQELDLDSAKVRDVLLTHSDRDHVGGLAAFPSARVFLPAGEVAMIDHTTSRFFGFIYNKPLSVSYETLVDGQELVIGDRSIRCIATPGHTVGHMSYLVDGAILISGDILGLDQGRIVMDRKFINIDNEKRRESIGRLTALSNVAYLCTMHSGYTDDFETAVREWK